MDIGSDCPIPDGYHVDYSEVTAPSWCTITSDMERREEAAGLIFHAVDAEGGFHLESRCTMKKGNHSNETYFHIKKFVDNHGFWTPWSHLSLLVPEQILYI